MRHLLTQTLLHGPPALAVCSKPTPDSKLFYVDPFIGTGFPNKDGKVLGYGGHTFPGASYPHGMVNLSPYTSESSTLSQSGYNYKDQSIRSFTHVNISGSGWSDGGDLGVMPMVGLTPTADGKTPDSNFPAIAGAARLDQSGTIHWTVDSTCRGGIQCTSWRGVIDKKRETAWPGYYEVTTRQIDVPSTITSRLTVGDRYGVHSYLYGAMGDNGSQFKPYVVLDLISRVLTGGSNKVTEITLEVDKTGTQISGSAKCGFQCWRFQYLNIYKPEPSDQMPLYDVINGRTFFSLKLNHKVKRVLMSSPDKTKPETVLSVLLDTSTDTGGLDTKTMMCEEGSSQYCPAIFLEFDQDMTKGFELEMVFAVSFTGIDGAKRNLPFGESGNLPTGESVEFSGFDSVCEATMAQWDSKFKKLNVAPHSGSWDDAYRLMTFYTALYHSYIHPTLASDVPERKGGTCQFQAYDQINRCDLLKTTSPWTNYTMFSSWDVFRNLAPLMAMLEPDLSGDFVNSIISRHWVQGGYMAMWEDFGGDAITQIGYPSVPFIVNAWKWGATNIKVEDMYEASNAVANMDVDSSSDGPMAIGAYLAHGYVPSNIDNAGFNLNKNRTSRSVSKTLEYAFEDYCIAQMAQSLNKTRDYDYYIKRSESWKNLFNPEQQALWPKDTTGKFIDIDTTKTWDDLKQYWIAGDFWGYNYFVPHDVEGLIDMYGGPDKFLAHVQHYFTRTDIPQSQSHIDISGWIGAYAHGEESSHLNAWLFNHVNKPDLTYDYVSKIASEFYKPNEDYGYINNDDLGQMSAWLVWSSIGLFPHNVCDTKLLVARPQFKKVELVLPTGKKLVITSGSEKFVTSIRLNHKVVDDLSKLDYLDLLKSETDIEIDFTTSPNDPKSSTSTTTSTTTSKKSSSDQKLVVISSFVFVFGASLLYF